jgi:ubiquitin carboxyl-terminal hydrolase L5
MPRRSGRAPKPRQREVYTSEAEEPEEGFHFIAYMPVAGHVWKLDGLNYHPQDLGRFESRGNGPDGGTGNWMHVAVPSIRGRMAQVEGTDISYNLMAVVHDLDHDDRVALLKNIKLIQVLDAKLDTMGEDWRELELGITKRGVVCGPSPALDIIQYDIDGVDVSNGEEDMIASEDDLIKLLEHRQRLIAKQDRLRIAVVDAKTSERGDQEKARHRRHDYTSFVRGWIGALAEAGVLKDIVE